MMSFRGRIDRFTADKVVAHTYMVMVMIIDP